jgi:cephalosporin hydroxylase
MNLLKKITEKVSKISLKTSNDPAVNIHCSEFEVNNWAISEFIVNELIPIVGIHPYPISELNLMVAAVCRLKPAHIFEWGTNIGKSARIFYETARHFKLNIHIHSIDLPDNSEHGEHPKSRRGMLVKDIEAVTLHCGDGLDKTLEIWSREKYPPAPLIFIDGDHSYESVRRELEGILTNIPSANILLHDTLYQSESSRYNIGPYKAIKEVLSMRSQPYRMISTSLGLPGMTLLYKL